MPLIDLGSLDGQWYLDLGLLADALQHPDVMWNAAELGRRTGVPPSTLRHHTQKIEGRPVGNRWWPMGMDGAKRAVDAARGDLASNASESEAKPAELFHAERQLERSKGELRKTKAQLKVAAKEANLIDAVTEMVQPVIDEYRISRQKPFKFAAPKRSGRVSMVWHCCDVHWGEYVDADRVGGVNAYSPEIAASRFEAHTDRTLQWVENMQMLHGVEEFVVFGMGDLISNLAHLHPEAVVQTAGAVVETLDVSIVLAQVITELSCHVDKVRIEASAGSNHGRTTKKNANSATLLQTNWDTMVWQWVRALTMNLSNVEVTQHPGYKAHVNVQGQRCAFAHGHLMRGGGGQLGIPAYALKRMHDSTVSRSVIETRQLFKDEKLATEVGTAMAALSRIVDHTRVGHFHTEGIWRQGMGSAGFVPSLMGPNEYAIDELEKFSPAGQMLEVFHPDRGIIGRHTIDVCDVMQPDDTRYSWGTQDGAMAAEVMAEWLDR